MQVLSTRAAAYLPPCKNFNVYNHSFVMIKDNGFLVPPHPPPGPKTTPPPPPPPQHTQANMAAAANLIAGQLPGAAAVPGLGAAVPGVPGLAGLGVPGAVAPPVGGVDAGVSAVPTESLMVSGMVTPQVLANQEEYEEVRNRGVSELVSKAGVVAGGGGPFIAGGCARTGAGLLPRAGLGV
jgi:hypothetical protein